MEVDLVNYDLKYLNYLYRPQDRCEVKEIGTKVSIVAELWLVSTNVGGGAQRVQK
ncbi:hypothetical protein [Brasilonema sp. UFV-L1]|uniref:hypothetical protein n=1 Tax=Brasilonema sp. UFV-L1 TaxID=2234130 RepID=UPI0030D7D87E